jgi:hypothetical protein
MIQWPSKAVEGTIELSLYLKWITKIPHCRNSSNIQNRRNRQIRYTYHTNTWPFTFLACYICYMRNYNVGLMNILCQVVYNGGQIVWLRRVFRIMMDKSSCIYNYTCLSSKAIPLCLCFCIDCLFWYACSWYNFWRRHEVIS